MRLQDFHKISQLAEGLLGMGKLTCAETMYEAIQNPDRFDRIYELIADEESKKTFDWFIKYRIAFAIIGEIAYDIFTPRITKQDLESSQKKLQKVSDNKYKIDNFIFKGNYGEVVEAFYFEQYAYKNVKPSSGDVIIDAGACFGDTALWFSKYIGNGRVYAFEPMEENFKILKENIKVNSLEKVIIPVQKGVGETESKLKISGYAGGASVAFGGTNGKTIDITSIDKFVSDNKIEHVDFIKMDIEGAELSALKGAVETIKEFKPNLAICVYHKGKDILEIPEYLISIVPEYNFYLKHNTDGFADTVLYCENKSQL
jgi:FkbM family methyltransferase